MVSAEDYRWNPLGLNCGCSPEGMEKQLISEYGRLHAIKNDIIDRLKSYEKNMDILL